MNEVNQKTEPGLKSAMIILHYFDKIKFNKIKNFSAQNSPF